MKTLGLATTPPACFSVGVRFAALFVLFCTAVVAGDPNKPIPKESRLYIEEIEGRLDQHIVAAIFMSKRKLSLKLVAVPDGADYFLRGTFQSIVTGGRATGYAAVNLVDAEGTIIWGTTASESSEYGTGVMSVARQIVRRLETVVEKD